MTCHVTLLVTEGRPLRDCYERGCVERKKWYNSQIFEFFLFAVNTIFSVLQPFTTLLVSVLVVAGVFIGLLMFATALRGIKWLFFCASSFQAICVHKN